MGAVNQKLSIRVYPRVHVTLLAMHGGEYRLNGGVGFAIAAPACEVRAREACRIEVEDKREHGLDVLEVGRIAALLDREKEKCNFRTAVQVRVEGGMHAHAGFGSTTGITLACLESLHRANGSQVSRQELVMAARRGGTSGIGVHTYFSGGCVFDLGRPLGDPGFAPSDSVVSFAQPLLLSRVEMPNWNVGLCIPRGIAGQSVEAENRFFRDVCPISPAMAYQTVYHALFGLYAAVLEADLLTFCAALRAIQECQWKRAERAQYGSALMELETALYREGAEAVAMSSFGPLLLFIARDVDRIAARMQDSALNCDCLSTSPLNRGREILDD